VGLRGHHLLTALAVPRFRRLFAVRIASQFGDGLFQASLAGAVLFNPQQAGKASDVATAFAVLLLPYSVIGPFAGVLIDRWWRRSVLRWANVVRAVVVLVVAAELASGAAGFPLYATALVVISLSRFVLAALSAALPRVVVTDELVTANALTSTVGTIAAALGGGTAVAVRALLGDGNSDYALIAAAAVVPYLVASLLASTFARDALGPSIEERRTRETPKDVWRGLQAGARVVRDTSTVRCGLAMLAVHRLLYGVWTVCTVLLYRNYFTNDGIFRAGLSGLSQIVAGVAIGGAIASFITPAAFRRFGPSTWPAVLLVASAVVEVTLVLPYTKPSLLICSLLLAITSQGIKISVDTLIQHDTDDAFRGRVFALYDMMFNLAAVLAAAATALVLPEDGHSPTSVLVLTLAWALTAVVYTRADRGRAALADAAHARV
jgi:MFS family permease